MDMAVEALLKSVSISAAYAACLNCLLQSDDLLAHDSPFIVFLKILRKLTQMLHPEELLCRMEETQFAIVGVLTSRWNSDLVSVRKAVVSCLAEIGKKIGHK